MVSTSDYETAAFALYRYAPSKPAAIFFDILFTAAALFHLFQMFRKKAWFMVPFIVGGFVSLQF
jgi:hypothetical protein